MKDGTGASLARVVLVLLLAGASAGTSCLGSRGLEPSAQERLTQAFPRQARLVLEGASVSRAAAPGERLTLRLPKRGDEPLHFAGRGIQFDVHERQLTSAEARREGSVTAFIRSDGYSYWRELDGAHEEWLLLQTKQSPRSEAVVVAQWRVAGATLRARAGAIEVLDAFGRARIEVTAPEGFAGDERFVPSLAVDGDLITLAVESRFLGQTLLIDPIWRLAGSMGTPRERHTATTLSNGRILVAGGEGATPLASAELYDPNTDSFSGAGALTTARRNHAAARLADGRVLVVGGEGPASVRYFSTELYDPALSSWTVAGPMGAARAQPTLTLLPNGKVLASGGLSSAGTALATAELYDPVTNLWTPTASMSAGRWLHTAALLPNGKVLVVGGGTNGNFSTACLASAELYDSAANSWSSGGAMATARCFHAMAQLPSNRLLVMGGEAVRGTAPLASAEQYDPVPNTWIPAGAMGSGRSMHSASELLSGEVVVTGGGNLKSSEVYDPVTDGWFSGTDLSQPRGAHRLNLLSGGKVLVTGGPATTELFDATLGRSCSGPAGCISGQCSDGVCCDVACAGACDRCNLAGAVGFCLAAPGGTPGSSSCAPYACSGLGPDCPTSCASDVQCDPSHYCSSNLCVPNGSGTIGSACRLDNQCASGACVDGVCCGSPCTGLCSVCNAAGTEGTCTPADAGSVEPGCLGYACAAGASCRTSCSGAADCGPSYHCAGTLCVPKKSKGTSCGSAVECLSGHCSEGVCCDVACDKPCDVCNVLGKVGTCSPAPLGDPGGVACAPYQCNGVWDNCPSTCLGLDTWCSPSNFCNPAYQCVPKGQLANGEPCQGKGDCMSAFCVDGVCCNTACSGGSEDCQACSVDAGGTTNGTCAPSAMGYLCRDPAWFVVPGATDSCVREARCSGTSGACPPMDYEPSSKVCRRSSNPTLCIEEGHCKGNGDFGCNADVVKPVGAVCRPSAGGCDVEEKCTFGNVCPADMPRPNGFACAPASVCAAGVCVGPGPFDAGSDPGMSDGGDGGSGGAGGGSGGAGGGGDNSTGGGIGGVGGGTTSSDGGPTPVPVRGCGCSSGSGFLSVGLALTAAALRRRRRRCDSAERQ